MLQALSLRMPEWCFYCFWEMVFEIRNDDAICRQARCLTVRVLADSGFDSDEFIDGVHNLGLHGVIGSRALERAVWDVRTARTTAGPHPMALVRSNLERAGVTRIERAAEGLQTIAGLVDRQSATGHSQGRGLHHARG